MKDMFRKNSAITLIAMVITIIILLILAGVGIQALTNTGLFDKTNQAKQKSKDATINEETKIGEYSNYVANYIDSSREQITNSNKVSILYPNGTENEPANISANQRIVVDNPYQGHIVKCIAQINYNGYWGETGWIYYNGGYGVVANQLTGDKYDKIVIQSGSRFIASLSNNTGNPLNIEGKDIEVAPFRIIVICED